jgi:prepilin-type N-terminal cleavage/methylation domain-containing protein
MKFRTNKIRTRAFTLTELLIVISIMGILAALILPVGKSIREKAAKSRARTELMKVDMAINAYKARMGHFPPDNTNNPALSPLYYELVGCKLVGGQYQTLTGIGAIQSADLPSFFQNPLLTGFVNVGGSGDDNSAAAVSFLKELTPAQFMVITNNNVPGAVLCTTLAGPVMLGTANPFRYNCSSPSNNINSYDLWVDLLIGGKTNRISNWSPQPQIVH